MNADPYRVSLLAVLLLVLLGGTAAGGDRAPDPVLDILVTLSNEARRVASSGAGEPYRNRKRYSMDPEVRRHAADVANDYALVEVDRWPIRSLSVFCFIYRLSQDADRHAVIERLQRDPRVDSTQPVQRFETLGSIVHGYNDTYVSLQRGLTEMAVPAAHRHSRGRGVRVAIVDGGADPDHEDLKGRLTEKRLLGGYETADSAEHGTAVASVIGANANNGIGIVGVAPEAVMELYVACRAEDGMETAVCESFTLAKALDAVVSSDADVLNLSLTGPYDPLLERLLQEVDKAGVVIVAAHPMEKHDGNGFPANLDRVIGVASSDGDVPEGQNEAANGPPDGQAPREVYAPGNQIMVALPDNAYDFRSGSSLSAAHVSGVIALLIAVAPELKRDRIHAFLQESQRRSNPGPPSVDACLVLQLSDRLRDCDEL